MIAAPYQSDDITDELDDPNCRRGSATFSSISFVCHLFHHHGQICCFRPMTAFYRHHICHNKVFVVSSNPIHAGLNSPNWNNPA